MPYTYALKITVIKATFQVEFKVNTMGGHISNGWELDDIEATGQGVYHAVKPQPAQISKVNRSFCDCVEQVVEEYNKVNEVHVRAYDAYSKHTFVRHHFLDKALKVEMAMLADLSDRLVVAYQVTVP